MNYRDNIVAAKKKRRSSILNLCITRLDIGWSKQFNVFDTDAGITIGTRKRALLSHCAGKDFSDLTETFPIPFTTIRWKPLNNTSRKRIGPNNTISVPVRRHVPAHMQNVLDKRKIYIITIFLPFYSIAIFSPFYLIPIFSPFYIITIFLPFYSIAIFFSFYFTTIFLPFYSIAIFPSFFLFLLDFWYRTLIIIDKLLILQILTMNGNRFHCMCD